MNLLKEILSNESILKIMLCQIIKIRTNIKTLDIQIFDINL